VHVWLTALVGDPAVIGALFFISHSLVARLDTVRAIDSNGLPSVPSNIAIIGTSESGTDTFAPPVENAEAPRHHHRQWPLLST
jgi:hypothetical protein